jgi:hypothetical protein
MVATGYPMRVPITAWQINFQAVFLGSAATVRRLFWPHSLFQKPSDHDTFAKLPRLLRALLPHQLIPMAEHARKRQKSS